MKARLSVLCAVLSAAVALPAADSQVSVPSCESARKSGEAKVIALPGGVEMEMVWCAPGKFYMGSPPSESGRFDNEARHAVSISRGFWIGRYEVTQRQWQGVMRNNPSRFKGPNNPVENVSWHDCDVFIRRIKQETGVAARLPTEAEWEYACRAGSDAPVAGNGILADMAWYDSNSDNQTHEVGRNKPNAWGIYDMHGNVLEWCRDWFSNPSGDAVDPKGPASGSFKVLRGGCWFFYERDCRSAYRLKREPNLRNCIFGFRIACSDIPEKAEAKSASAKTK